MYQRFQSLYLSAFHTLLFSSNYVLGDEIMTNRIKELRKQHGYRQEDLAEALNVSRQTIIAIENDKYNPTLELAMKLARYLNTTVEELFIPDI